MKCVFDGQLNSQDSVLMKLYKRIYPKWTYENDSDSYSIGANKEETEENEMETG